jgi:hypothetical protein
MTLLIGVRLREVKELCEDNELDWQLPILSHKGSISSSSTIHSDKPEES